MLDTVPTTPAVPPESPSRPFCRLAIVAESATPDDVDKMRPFSGSAGSLLNAILRSAGVDRSECLLLHLYPHVLASVTLQEERRKRGPAEWDAYHAACLARLWEAIDAHAPPVIVPLSQATFQALGGVGALSVSRGCPVQAPPRDGKPPYKLLPTYSPQFVQAQWKMFQVVIGDFVKAASEAARGRTLILPTRRLRISPTIEEVEAFLGPGGPARTCSLLSCDIETGWGMIRGISFAPSEEDALYVPFMTFSTVSRSYWPTPALEKRAWLAVKGALESDVPKLGQNFAGYDMPWLLRKANIRVRNVRHDLRLLHAALHPELPKSLAFMASAYSRQGSWKGWAKHSQLSQAARGDKRDE